MSYLLKYIKILRITESSIDIENAVSLYTNQHVVLSNNFYNIPTQVAYINNDQE